jgi:predicted DsbA family dithiol-disulfide isomerase
MSQHDVPTIEVFADIWCTFAHVGLRAVAEHRRRLGRDDVAIHVRAWPLELVNNAPMDPAKAAEHVVELREYAAPDTFAGFDIANFPHTTLPALALVARAQRADAHLGERASFLVRDTLFEHGRNIADAQVLADLAQQLGIDMPDDQDHAAVLADWEAGKERGVIGSPHFFGAGRDEFCPSLQITRADHGLTIHRNAERLSTFLDEVFAARP